MHRIIVKFVIALFLSSLMVGCFGWGGNNTDDDFPIAQSIFLPVIMQRVDFENSVTTISPQNIIKAGKIYVFDNFLFINDVNEGFHMYNYSNPLNPVPLCYLKVPGATDLAIRNNILYINQATDLLTLEYNYQNNTFDFLYRNINVFPQKISPDGFYFNTGQNDIIVNWTTN